MNTILMMVALIVSTPEYNGDIDKKFDWNEFRYTSSKPRGMFEKPEKTPSITRVHRVIK